MVEVKRIPKVKTTLIARVTTEIGSAITVISKPTRKAATLVQWLIQKYKLKLIAHKLNFNTPNLNKLISNFTMNVNFKSPDLSTTDIPQENIKGSIVNIFSISDSVSHIGFIFSIYESSKAALTRQATSLAVELAKLQITINTVAPGFVVTPMQARVKSNPRIWANIENTVYLRKIVNPKVIARNIYHTLCKPTNQTGNRIVTGEGITVDGYNLIQH